MIGNVTSIEHQKAFRYLPSEKPPQPGVFLMAMATLQALVVATNGSLKHLNHTEIEKWKTT